MEKCKTVKNTEILLALFRKYFAENENTLCKHFLENIS